MDLRRFLTFRTVVEEGSFVRAAHKLCCTQSTVTFHIQQLEQDLSLQLFEKIGRRMRLTERGKAILPHVHELTQVLDTLRQAAHTGEQAIGELRIATGETLLAYLMPQVLQEFRLQAPQVRLSLRALNCYTIRDTLLAGETDLGLFYRVGKDAGLHEVELGSFALVLVASPHLASVDFSVSHQRLPLSFIINEAQCVFRLIFENTLRQRNIVLDNTIELWSIESIKKCVASNLGISYLPRFTVERELAAGELQEIPFPCDTPSITALYAYHSGKCITPAMQLFMRLTNEFFTGKALCEPSSSAPSAPSA